MFFSGAFYLFPESQNNIHWETLQCKGNKVVITGWTTCRQHQSGDLDVPSLARFGGTVTNLRHLRVLPWYRPLRRQRAAEGSAAIFTEPAEAGIHVAECSWFQGHRRASSTSSRAGRAVTCLKLRHVRQVRVTSSQRPRFTRAAAAAARDRLRGLMAVSLSCLSAGLAASRPLGLSRSFLLLLLLLLNSGEGDVCSAPLPLPVFPDAALLQPTVEAGMGPAPPTSPEPLLLYWAFGPLSGRFLCSRARKLPPSLRLPLGPPALQPPEALWCQGSHPCVEG